jgi:outer membrane lipoprotein SlyB
MSKRNPRLMLAVLALAMPACGSSPTSSNSSSATRTTETFTGTLAQKATSFHLFTVQQIGQVDVVLTKTEPVGTITVGLGIGQTAAGSCIPVMLAYNNSAVAGSVLSGTADVGSYCVAVYDVGTVTTDALNYTVTVTHP